MIKNIQLTPVFEKNYDAKTRIVVNQGGSRSSKTYSICQLLITLAYSETGQVFTIVRKTFPALRLTVMRDFFEILDTLGIYNESSHNKTESTYKLNGNLFEFVSMDMPQKKRGSKRKYLFLNEANELNYEDWIQLNIRTTGRVWIDYNPSDEYHWIYDKIIPREDCTFIKSTYLDNPFIEQNIIDEIERFKETDENYWRVYGLGERGQSKSVIFPNILEYKELPQGAKLKNIGLDFGYSNDPTAVVEVYELDNDRYYREILYRTGLTNSDIKNELINLGIDLRTKMICDSAEPKSIEELRRMGVNAHPVKKFQDSIRAGIDIMRTKKIHVHEFSVNLRKEFRNYKWMEDKNGNLLSKPVDLYNHAIDASRYALLQKTTSGKLTIF